VQLLFRNIRQDHGHPAVDKSSGQSTTQPLCRPGHHRDLTRFDDHVLHLPLSFASFFLLELAVIIGSGYGSFMVVRRMFGALHFSACQGALGQSQRRYWSVGEFPYIKQAMRAQTGGQAEPLAGAAALAGRAAASTACSRRVHP